MEENSISIINRSNTQVVGERAQAIPIKLMGQFSWTKYVLIGFFLAILIVAIFIGTIKKNVVTVDVSGTSPEFKIFKVN